MTRNTDLSLARETQKASGLHTSFAELIKKERIDLSEIDSNHLKKQLSVIRAMAQLTSSGITVYDVQKGAHVYTSRNFYELFGYKVGKGQASVSNRVFDERVHPDDLPVLEKNGCLAMQFLLEADAESRKNYKMVNEYRICGKGGVYIRVIEQHRVLEQDTSGNIRLSLGIIDISPDQSLGAGVKFQLLDLHSGELVHLNQVSRQEWVELTTRETEVLEMVRDGKLSKEISYLLAISIHTVNTHRQRILEKLDVNNSIEAVYTAKNRGLIS